MMMIGRVVRTAGKLAQPQIERLCRCELMLKVETPTHREKTTWELDLFPISRMQLINTSTLKFEEFELSNAPRYAILSHTWDDN